jgi:hypothetical protein
MKRNSSVFLAILLWSAGLGASLGDSNEEEARAFANVRRIESLVAVLDTGDVYKAERCTAAVAHP